MSGGCCPFCGAWTTSACEIEDGHDGCPWEEMDADEMRDDRDERRRLEKESGE